MATRVQQQGGGGGGQTIGPWVRAYYIPNNLNASPLLIANFGSVGYAIPRAGKVVSLSVSMSAPVNSGGPLLAQIFKNGALLVGTNTMVNPGSSVGVANFDVGGIAAGDVLDVRITTGDTWDSTSFSLTSFIEAQF